MLSHKDTTLPLAPEYFFHIFNRGNKGVKIFYQERNYHYFLEKFNTALSPYLEMYCYCLIPNHFHFLVRIKTESEIFSAAINGYKRIPKSMWKAIRSSGEEFPPSYIKDFPPFLQLLQSKNLDDQLTIKYLIGILPNEIKYHLAGWLVSDTFRKFFAAYAKAINKQQNEAGSLFQKNFRRKLVDSDAYFTQLIWYIHNNGAHHGLCNRFEDYLWNSYHEILGPSKSMLQKSHVLAWFGGRSAYIDFHRNAHANWSLLNKVIIEEDGAL